MQIRVCPVCDQKMHSAHYCKTCRRFVRRPYIRTVDYYMNEQPPHSVQRPAETGQMGGWAARNPWNPSPGEQWRPVIKKSGKGSRAALVGFIILLTAVVMGMLWVGVALRYEEAPDDIWTTVENEITEFNPSDFDLDDFDLNDWVEDYEELTDEEVMLAGVACNTCGHFQTTGQEMEDMLVQFLKEGEYRMDSRTEYSFNNRYDDGDTWFSSSVIYYLRSKKADVYPMLSVDADTATGRLHEVDIVLENPAEAVAMTRKVLAFLTEKGDFVNDEEATETMLAELMEAFEWEEEFYFQIGDVNIDGYVFENEYSVYISREPQ